MPSVRDIIFNNDTLYLGEAGGNNVYISTTDGEVWTSIGKDIPPCFVLSIGSNSEIFSGSKYNGVLMSTNNGMSWSSLGPDGLGAISGLSASVEGDLYATDNQKLYRTTNLGATWDDLSAKMPGYKIRCISTDTNGGIYVGAYYPSLPSTGLPDGVLLISKDRGDTWSFHRSANPSMRINDIGVTSIGDIIVVTEETSIFRITNNATTWEAFWDGFLHNGGSCITVTPTGRVFVGASGTVYELMNYPTSAVQPLPSSSFALHAAYPNPVAAGGNASIGFALPTEEYVTIALYNTTGQQVAKVAQGVYQPGEHIVTLRTAGLPAGMYLCRMITGRFQSSKAVQVR